MLLNKPPLQKSISPTSVVIYQPVLADPAELEAKTKTATATTENNLFLILVMITPLYLFMLLTLKATSSQNYHHPIYSVKVFLIFFRKF